MNIFVRKQVWCNISFCKLHIKGMPKSANSIEFPLIRKFNFLQKCRVQVFDLGPNRELSTVVICAIGKISISLLESES